MLLKSKKDQALYELLEKQANVATRSAEAFLAMVRDFDNLILVDAIDELPDNISARDDLEHAPPGKFGNQDITVFKDLMFTSNVGKHNLFRIRTVFDF